ncbi:hypothetical protein ACVXZ4_04075 [Lacisediminihabitans sp. FW035]
MVIVSQLISALLFTALGGLMFVLITGGVKIQAENNAQSELRIANRAFITELSYASAISPQDDTSVTIVQQKFLKDATFTDSNPVYKCRTSHWYLAPASSKIRTSLGDSTLMALKHDVTVFTDDSTDPKTGICTGTITSTQQQTAVAAVSIASVFRYTNIAGVSLQYNNGIVTTFAKVAASVPNSNQATSQTDGIDPNSTDPAQVAAMTEFRAVSGPIDPSTGVPTAVNTFYTNSEMLRETPKIVEAHLTAIMPISGKTAAVFKGTTTDAVTELIGNNSNVVDPGAAQNRWVPNPIKTVAMMRSKTDGVYVGHVREGIRIQWTPVVTTPPVAPGDPPLDCPASQTPTYQWLLTNTKTGHQTSGETLFNFAEITSFSGPAEVWNGDNYRAQISARCNDTDGQSVDTSANFILPLPNVTDLSIAAAPGDQSTQSLTWSPASSDPSTRYSVSYSPASLTHAAEYTLQPLDLISEPDGARDGAHSAPAWLYPSMAFTGIPGSPTSTTNITKSGNSITPGLPDTYQVFASTSSGNFSPNPTPANYTYSTTAIPPTITDINEASFSWSASACAAGSTAEFRAAANTGSGDSTGSAIGSATAQTALNFSYPTIGEGEQSFARVDQRCTNRFVGAPTNSQTELSPWSSDSTGHFVRPVSAPTSITVASSATTASSGATVHVYGLSVNGCNGTTPAWTRGGLDTYQSFAGPTSRTYYAYGQCIGNYASSGETGGSRTVSWLAPPPPKPATPSAGCGDTFQTAPGKKNIANASWSCSPVSYATSYFGKMVGHWNDGTDTTSSGSSGSPSFNKSCTSGNPGYAWTSITFSINASNGSGTSGSWTTTDSSSNGTSASCG